MSKLCSSSVGSREEYQRVTAVSQKKPRKWGPLDINTLVNDLVKLTAESMIKEQKVAVHIDLDPALPKLISARDSLKQILINLMKNASEAMTKGGNLYLKTRYRSTPLEGSKDRGFVEVTVADDGPGIDTEILPKLFSPVESTKGEGHAGLGLTIVKNLVNELDGSISCRSSDKGTSFHILLPK